jgi:2-C-methyl-D-erythritol 4-phosphate cytidylyltransferase
MSCAAIIPAAGQGLRMGGSTPKPYLMLGDKPILAHTLQAFEDCPDITEIYVVAQENQLAHCRQNIIDRYQFRKVTQVIAGGEQRQDSVYNGLQALAADTEIVVVHDGARPLIHPQLISRCIQETRRCGAVIVARPLTDTIKQVSSAGLIDRTIPRNALWAAQTPQVFTCPLLKRAFVEAYQQGFRGTDEASLVERLGHKIKVIEGSAYNVKITTPEDMVIAEAILTRRHMSDSD